jgi:hypothetical protein
MAPELPFSGSGEAGSATTAAVHVTRELPAPRGEVFRTWTEPDLFKGGSRRRGTPP